MLTIYFFSLLNNRLQSVIIFFYNTLLIRCELYTFYFIESDICILSMKSKVFVDACNINLKNNHMHDKVRHC